MIEKYLVIIEFRYSDAPKYEDDSTQFICKTVTLGVFDTMDEANLCGNEVLKILESKFKLNSNYNKRERFSNNGGPFGYAKDLITNLGYLQTPFEFYAKITKLKYDNIEETIDTVMEAVKRYVEYKQKEELQKKGE